MWSIARKT